METINIKLRKLRLAVNNEIREICKKVSGSNIFGVLIALRLDLKFSQQLL